MLSKSSNSTPVIMPQLTCISDNIDQLSKEDNQIDVLLNLSQISSNLNKNSESLTETSQPDDTSVRTTTMPKPIQEQNSKKLSEAWDNSMPTSLQSGYFTSPNSTANSTNDKTSQHDIRKLWSDENDEKNVTKNDSANISYCTSNTSENSNHSKTCKIIKRPVKNSKVLKEPSTEITEIFESQVKVPIANNHKKCPVVTLNDFLPEKLQTAMSLQSVSHEVKEYEQQIKFNEKTKQYEILTYIRSTPRAEPASWKQKPALAYGFFENKQTYTNIEEDTYFTSGDQLVSAQTPNRLNNDVSDIFKV